MSEENRSIEAAAAAVREAQEIYNDAHEAAQEKRQTEQSALNALNRAQAEFDVQVRRIKWSAPQGSNWYCQPKRD